MPSYIRDRVPMRRVTNRLNTGIPRAKWLDKLEQEKNLDILTRFEERHTKGYYNTAIIRYFLTDKPYILN